MSITQIHPHKDDHARAGYYPDHERVTALNRMADGITELVAHLDAGTYQLLKLICEFDENNGWSGPGVNSCAHWLNWKCGMSMGSARERVRVSTGPSLRYGWATNTSTPLRSTSLRT